MFLEEAEDDRDEKTEDSDELRPGPVFAVALTAGLTVVVEGGAGGFFLIGSPAMSARVLLLNAGSETSHELSKQCFLGPADVPLERACLRTGGGGGIAPVLRALVVDADISFRALSGDIYRVGWRS